MRHRLLLIFVCVAPSNAAPPPVPYDRWGNQGGMIQAACPAGYTCTESSSSTNMLQRILTRNNSGETYIQVIIDDVSPTNGTHRSETFVNASNPSNTSIPFSDIGTIMPITPVFGNDVINTVNLTSANTGIATKYTLAQTGFGTGSNSHFDYSTQISTGWASTPGQPAFFVQEHITNTTPQNIFFDYSYDYQQNRNANGRITGWSYALDNFVQNSSVITVAGGTPDDQRFIMRRVSGDFITAGTATLPPSVGGMGMGMMGGAAANPANGAGAPPPGTVLPSPQATPFPNPPGAATGNPMGMGAGGVPPGGTVAWNTGDEVQVIWIGQVCPGCIIGGMGMMGGMGTFGFMQYENITRGQAAASRSIIGTAPFIWNNPPFGAQPQL